MLHKAGLVVSSTSVVLLSDPRMSLVSMANSVGIFKNVRYSCLLKAGYLLVAEHRLIAEDLWKRTCYPSEGR